MVRRRLRSANQLRRRGRGKRQQILGGLYSKSEKFFLDVIEEMYNVKIDRQYMLRNRFFDGRFGDHLLEIDGERWHSRPEDRKRDFLKDKLAERYGFKLHRIRLNNVRGVPMAIAQYKTLLEEIFNGSNSGSKSKLSTPKG